MRMRTFVLCSLVVMLLVSGVASAQMPPPPGDRPGAPANGGGGGGGRGRPGGGGNGGNGGGQQQPPPPPPGGNGGQQPPPPPNGNGGGNGGNGGGGNGGGIAFPSGYASDFALYAVVDRPDNVSRLLYINPESLAAMQTGQPLPEGTTIVIEGYESTPNADGTLARGALIPFIHVSEVIGGRWRFASFSPAGTRSDPTLPDENPRTCVNCHNDTRDFVFTRPLIDAFAQSGTVQYFFCGQTGREPCN